MFQIYETDIFHPMCVIFMVAGILEFAASMVTLARTCVCCEKTCHVQIISEQRMTAWR